MKKYLPALKAAVKKVEGTPRKLTLGIVCQPYNYDAWLPIAEKMDTGLYRLGIMDGKTGHIKNEVASWELVQMKNCCGICVSTAAQVMPAFRKQGIGLVLNQIRIDLARAMGYSLLFCTDVIKNEAQQKILTANGWRRIHTFLNRGSGNVVGLHVIGL
jgi:GNAT superfamily N-acetyltransferase